MQVFNILISIFAMSLMTSCGNNPNVVESNTVKNDNPVEVIAETTNEVVEETISVEGANTKVVKLTTPEFIDQIFDYKSNPTEWKYKGDKPAIIDFYADWCGPCKRVAPIMDELAAEYAGQINIYKVDTDKEKELAGQVFGIRSIPSILYIPVNGQPTMYTGAFAKERYVELINENLLVK